MYTPGTKHRGSPSLTPTKPPTEGRRTDGLAGDHGKRKIRLRFLLLL
jgi:hypothetical protein